MRHLVLAAALAAGVAFAAPATAQTTLRVANWLPMAHPIMADMVAPWTKEVEAATGGRVKLNILTSPLGPPPAHLDFAVNGVADVVYSVHGYTPGRFALTELAELPFLSDSAEALSVAYWRAHERMLAAAGEHKGVKLLSVFVHGPGHIYNARKPVLAAGDLAGLKIRTGGGVVNAIAKELGVVAVAAPSTQAFELLSNGVADGIFFPHESVAFFKIERALKHATIVPGGLYTSSFFLAMNQARWDALPKADQDVVMAASGEAFARRAGAAWDKADAAGLAAIRAAGIAVETASPAFKAELEAKLAPVVAAALAKAQAKGVDGAAVVAALKADAAAYGK